ncbi:hypothetical protein [Butyrivibrio sp. AE3004]|uniref:hypothetical protein n=1 Tax=Butyrivibrio sp. AE3004 TaxID=1506994 RepID=UPI000493FAC4|nr:hypothetical protein [Butyrivibrio sp. AE3004]
MPDSRVGADEFTLTCGQVNNYGMQLNYGIYELKRIVVSVTQNSLKIITAESAYINNIGNIGRILGIK